MPTKRWSGWADGGAAETNTEVRPPETDDEQASTALYAPLGLAPRTIQKYRQVGLLTPDLESAGGHARWDVGRVRAELRLYDSFESRLETELDGAFDNAETLESARSSADELESRATSIFGVGAFKPMFDLFRERAIDKWERDFEYEYHTSTQRYKVGTKHRKNSRIYRGLHEFRKQTCGHE